MRWMPLCCGLLLILAAPAAAGQKTITLYLDGARVEQELAAQKGYLECPLPQSYTPGSLRVKPLAGASVLRVELVPAEADRRRAQEISRLEERISELQDRLQALSRQEEIFSAAVKLQSGKAPRKSKANPDPVSSLARGTEFALAQLESVYRGKRRCRKSLETLEQELARARKGAVVARVWLSSDKARLSYTVGGTRWVPSYAFRWAGDATGELVLHAKLPPAEKGALYAVSPGTLAQGQPSRSVRGEFPVLSRNALTLSGTATGPNPPVSFAFAGTAGDLPPGEAAAYWRGEYLGSGRFAGGGAGEFSLIP
ncbi:hypothetical protein GMLC_43750 [Geomonas limicola]|uniref:DUF4140 domain-containing protein n=2 Tax=Geomonas limicola TaxID=2740186 RepID=A0A6V8NE23_9BACT|nr:hypothetical protein GMLC_43750 [Geomonas limicola]